MSTGWNRALDTPHSLLIINLLGNEYWLEPANFAPWALMDYKPTGK